MPKTSAAYTPPPPEGFISPMLWGVESQVRERFVAAGVAADDIAFTRGSFVFDFAGTPAAYLDEFRRYYGPMMNAFDAAQTSGRADALQGELEALFEHQNKSGSEAHTTVEATFLRVTVSVR